MRILLAEDEKDLNKIITARLKDEYYSVDSCFDGKEAEEYLTAVKYDAVILDIMMPKTCYTIADLEVHLDTHKVIRGKEEIRLSGKEFALLRYMVQNAGIVLSRDRLEQHLWNYDYMGSSNVIDVYIRYLRKKIDDGREKKLIHTVRGVGYVLKEEE